MFRNIEYGVAYPVDLKTGCPCQQIIGGQESGPSQDDRRQLAGSEPLRRLIPEARKQSKTESTPRRGNCAFFGAWTDTREE
jgi:hypothetical protein